MIDVLLRVRPNWLVPFDNWLNRTFIVWSVSMVVMVLVSLATKPPDPAKLAGIIWSWKTAALPKSSA